MPKRIYTSEQIKARNSTPAAKARKLRWTNTHPDHKKLAHRLKRYGISPQYYDQLMLSQNKRCKICLKEFSGTACVDHNHATGEVRALLCTQCNAALGMCRESEFNLARLISYLKYTNTVPSLENWANYRFVDLDSTRKPLPPST